MQNVIGTWAKVESSRSKAKSLYRALRGTSFHDGRWNVAKVGQIERALCALGVSSRTRGRLCPSIALPVRLVPNTPTDFLRPGARGDVMFTLPRRLVVG
jgi:hypothetical protein